jgi:hypothetical protein
VFHGLGSFLPFSLLVFVCWYVVKCETSIILFSILLSIPLWLIWIVNQPVVCLEDMSSVQQCYNWGFLPLLEIWQKLRIQIILRSFAQNWVDYYILIYTQLMKSVMAVCHSRSDDGDGLKIWVTLTRFYDCIHFCNVCFSLAGTDIMVTFKVFLWSLLTMESPNIHKDAHYSWGALYWVCGFHLHSGCCDVSATCI